MTGRSSLYYDAVAREHEASADENGGRWRTLHREVHDAPFLLQSPRGTVLVHPVMAKSVGDLSYKAKLTGQASGGPLVDAFLAEAGGRETGVLGGHPPTKVQERSFSPGDEVFIYGTVRPINRRADDRLLGSITTGAPSLVIGHGEDDRPFLLGTGSDRMAFLLLAKTALLFIAGGLIALAAGIVLVLLSL